MLALDPHIVVDEARGSRSKHSQRQNRREQKPELDLARGNRAPASLESGGSRIKET